LTSFFQLKEAEATDTRIVNIILYLYMYLENNLFIFI